jgi:hypothetical protein
MTVRGVPKSMRWVLPLTVAVGLLVGFEAPSVRATSSVPTRDAKSAFPPMLGFSFHGQRTALAWYDPVTLTELRGRKAPLAGWSGYWAFNADRSLLAVGRCNRPGLRLVDARAMRIRGDVELSPYPGCAARFTWLRPDRLLATVSLGRQGELMVVDPVARRVVRHVELPAPGIWASGRTRDALVLLLVAGEGTIGPARLAVVDAEGTVRSVGIDRILAGSVVDEASEQPHSRIVSPGLALDPSGGRAFVVPATGPVAEVDLATLEVSYHELDLPSPLGRFLRWLQPSAQAKGPAEGPMRQAQWLGNGLIAVSGADHSFVRGADGAVQDTSTPAGLRLVDTRTWKTRMLDPDATGFVLGPSILVARDGPRSSRPGFRAFGFDGSERWRLPAAPDRYLVPAGPVGYVYLSGTKAEVVDLPTGKVLRTIVRKGPWPQLLAAQSSG